MLLFLGEIPLNPAGRISESTCLGLLCHSKRFFQMHLNTFPLTYNYYQ